MLPTDLLGKASSVLLEKLEADFCIEFVHISNGSDFVMGWEFMQDMDQSLWQLFNLLLWAPLIVCPSILSTMIISLYQTHFILHS